MTIQASVLSKTYQSRSGLLGRKTVFQAVRDLSFEIGAGETVAFLGPNGAGKSTTIKMLCGILTPTSGEASVLGLPAGSKAANRSLGLVFGTRSQLFMHMTVRQSLDLIGDIYFLGAAERKKRITELADLFEIAPYLERRVRGLSLGERMRCEVVASLLHRPKILLADEPTIGLDVVAKNRLRELVLRWQREEKTTLMLTSHDLSDVEALCDRCILIDHGEKKYDGRLDGVKGDLGRVRRVQVTVAHADVPRFTADPSIAALGGEEFQHGYEILTGRTPMSVAVSKLSAHYGDHLQDIQISEVSLEEVLRNLFGKRPS